MQFRYLIIAAVITFAIYWPGLNGPFLLDDFGVLRPVEQWLNDGQSWVITLLPQDSLVFSRPVAMASFMLSMAMGGSGPFPLKFGNLFLHVACGFLVFWILRRCLRLDNKIGSTADTAALVGATIWLMHPLHVSTVLYAVQRMTQLSSFFSLAAVTIYLIARARMTRHSDPIAIGLLFLAFPVCMGLGLLSKQNAAIAGFLCLALELAYFPRRDLTRASLRTFYSLFVLLPLAAVILLLATRPQALLAGYGDWDFTLAQRLLTQPRALMDYLGMWFIPRTPRMGLYTDTFPISTGSLSPPSTLLALLAIAAISVGAIVVRKRAPSLFAGWFFFLCAHAVESTFLPIEMYYEHRNYLPSIGLLLAFMGAQALLPGTLRKRLEGGNVLRTCVGLVLTVLAFSTFGRVMVWQSEAAMLAQGADQHPDSLRVKLDQVSLALRTDQPDAAIAILQPLLTSDDPRHRLVARMDLIAIDCWRGRDPRISDLPVAVADARDPLTLPEVHAVKLLTAHARKEGCSKHALEFAEAFEGMLDKAAHQPESMPNKYGIRLLTAETYARAGRWKDAQRHLEISWTASGDLPTGMFLARAYWHNGYRQEARDLLRMLAARTRSFDTRGQRELTTLRQLITP